MTAQSWTGNLSKFGTYFRYKLHNMRSMIILNCIFALLTYPLAVGMMIPTANLGNELNKRQDQGTIEYEQMRNLVQGMTSVWITCIFIAFAMLVALFLMNFVICQKNYRWLYNKNVVDMDYSLPVSDDTRFFGDLLATLSVSLIPHLAAIIIGIVLSYFLPISDLPKYEQSLVDEVRGVFVQLAFTGFVACIMFVGVTLLVMSLCGRKKEARIYPFVVNAAIPIIHALCMYIVTSHAYGCSADELTDFTSIAFTSPLGLLFTSIGSFADDGIFFSTHNLTDGTVTTEVVYTPPLFRPEVLIPLIIITLLCFTAAYFLIKHRRAERVGSSFVFRAVNLILPAIVIFTITAPFAANILNGADPYYPVYNYHTHNIGGNIVAMCVITFIVSVIIELVSGKGFKKFHITLAKYVVTLAASFGICTALYYSNGMGAAYFVPAVDSVSSVRYYINNNIDRDRSVSGTVTQPQYIADVIEVHADIPKNGPECDEMNYSLSLTYFLKDGSKIERFYAITEERYNEMARSLVNPEQCFAMLGGRTPTNEMLHSRIIDIQINDLHYVVDMPYEEIINALRKDSEKASYELLCDSDSMQSIAFYATYKYAQGYTTTAFSVYPWCENTIELLKSKGIPLFEGENVSQYKTAFLIERNDFDINYDVYSAQIDACFVVSFGEQAVKDYNDRKWLYELYGFDSYFEEYGEDAVDVIKDAYFGENAEIVRVQIDESNIDLVNELRALCSSNVASDYSAEKLYTLVLTSQAEFYSPGAVHSNDEYYVKEENLGSAEEIIDQLFG